MALYWADRSFRLSRLWQVMSWKDRRKCLNRDKKTAWRHEWTKWIKPYLSWWRFGIIWNRKVFRIYSSLITAACYALYVRRLQCDELMYWLITSAVWHPGVMSCRHGLLWLMLLMVSRLCHIVVGDELFLKTYCILWLCKSIPFAFQKVPFQPAKGHVSACRLPSFAKQAVFVVPALGLPPCCCAFHSRQHFMPYPLCRI